MSPDELQNTALVETIPQLYFASAGPFVRTNTVGSHSIAKYSQRALTPDLSSYLRNCNSFFSQIRLSSPLHEEVEYERIQQICASIWLERQTGISKWPLILDYFSKVQKRTIENTPVIKTLVIDRNTPASQLATTFYVNDKLSTKVIDWVASSPFTYLRATEDLQFISYNAIQYSQVAVANSYQFVPGFLLPVVSQMHKRRPALGFPAPDPEEVDRFHSDILISSNQRGDIVVASKDSILASRRKSKWTVYDAPTIKNTFHDCIGHFPGAYGVACNLFQILFDMSFKRHGGLILLDSNLNKFMTFVSGGIMRGTGNPLEALMPQNSFGTVAGNQDAIRKLLEISSVDGAVLIDHTGSVEGFGAMVTSSNTSGATTQGARTTAAKAAVSAGATAFKVSSDGEISVFFTTPAQTQQAIHEIKFL